MKNCSPWEAVMLGKFKEDCLSWDNSTLEHGKSVRSAPHKEERATETVCDELTTVPHSLMPCAAQRKEGEKIRNKVKSGKKRGMGRRCF